VLQCIHILLIVLLSATARRMYRHMHIFVAAIEKVTVCYSRTAAAANSSSPW
jgi:hypothetical protein